MSTLRDFRKKTGLSQRQIALLLGVTQSAIKRAELGQGGLTDDAWQKFHELEKCAERKTSLGNPLLLSARQELRNKLISKLEKMREEFLFEQKVLKRKLADMQSEFQSAFKAMQIMESQGRLFSIRPKPQDPGYKSFQSELKKFINNSTEEQYMIEMQLEMIYDSLALVNGQIEMYRNGKFWDFDDYWPTRRH